VWSFASMLESDVTLLQSISREALAKISAFSMLEFANTAWSLATLSFESKPLMAALSPSALPKLADCSRTPVDGF